MLVAFILTFIAIPSYIRFLHRHHLGKKIREEATIGKATEFYNLHKAKGGTPTMGAGIILLVIGFLVIISVLIGAFSDSIAAFYAWMVQTLHLQSM
jgi:UDP-N-acetylmuramyl pentapeptide phosphotransferase/UDP-N-acetylglucosamine-1-phosphate transferase